jgi:DNA-directed RNA polymerase subunit RPC12/RpoP
MDNDFDDDEPTNANARLTGFDCVDCNANNPVDDGFGAGDEVTCHYCGSSFRVVNVNGKLKFKQL